MCKYWSVHVVAIQNIKVVGQSEQEVVITCASSIGLAFYNVSNLLIKNIQINGCSLKGTNLRNVFAVLDSSIQFFYYFPNSDDVGTGLMLGHCCDVNVENVTM